MTAPGSPSAAGPRPQVAAPYLAVGGLLGQTEFAHRLLHELEHVTSVDVRPVSLTTLRAEGTADRRVPLTALGRVPLRLQPALASALYGRSDLVHRLDGRLPAARNEVLTLHDVAPLRYHDEGIWPGGLTPSAQRARAVVTPSEFAAREARELLEIERVHVVPNGVDPDCFETEPLRAQDRAALGITRRPFVLTVGGSTDRKNLAALAAIWADPDGPDADLVLAGPPSARKSELFGDVAGVYITGTLPRPILLHLLRSAAALIVPSHYEGFGLPVLEGFAVGTPVVCAKTSALVEVAGDLAVMAEPSPQGLRAGLEVVLTGVSDRRLAAAKAHARRFTWAAAAARYAEIYVSCLESRSAASSR